MASPLAISRIFVQHEILQDLLEKYMREQTMENDIWDEVLLGTVVGALGPADQLIIDRSIMEEVKVYHQILSVSFYESKKTYDKVQLYWMAGVYKWIGIPEM